MSAQTLDPASPFGHASFEGRSAVITGGTQGLGFATAQLLAARGASDLVIVGRDPDKGARAEDALSSDTTRCSFVSADLSTVDGVERAVDHAQTQLETVHAFVNCAAATSRGTVWNTTAAMWDEMLTLNVRMPGLMISAMAKIMKRSGTSGAMVLIGSIAHHGGNTVLYNYSPSKHALETMVRNAAFSLMSEGIRVNLLNPGWMDTPAEDAVQKRFHDADDNWLATAEAAQPTGRLLKPQEVARAICFLASDESGMMTGASIDIDQTMPGVGDLPRAEPVPEQFPWENA